MKYHKGYNMYEQIGVIFFTSLNKCLVFWLVIYFINKLFYA